MNRLQRGISMVELLVTIVIFAVGLLGVASLQMFTLKMNTNADVRTRASLLAGDIIERMRANPLQYASYEMSFDQCLAAVTEDPDASSDIAVTDKRQWCAHLDRDLPGAAASVDFDNGVAIVTVRWQEREGREQVDAEGVGTGSEWSTSEFVMRGRLE